MYIKVTKRVLDLVLSSIALTILCIPLTLFALVVLFDVGYPIFYRQKRIGKNNEEFYLLKFRTMSNKKDVQGVLLPDDERVTKVGRFLRMTSIDELPSLINIIVGQMSIVGPRPLPVRYLNRYTSEQLRRHNVLPGLTNLSAIKGRNLLTWDDKFKMDVWYVDNVSFRLDIKIIFQTVVAVLSRKGVSASDGDARSEFIGVETIEEVKKAGGSDYIKL